MGKKINNSKDLYLYAAIEGFLKDLSFVESASVLTLKAYWLDLRQAFQIPEEHLLPEWGPQKDGNFTVEGPAFKVQGPQITEHSLLSFSKAALLRWGPLAPASRNRKAATLKSLLSWLHQKNWISSELSQRIRGPKVPQRLPHYISVDEVLSVLESFPKAIELETQKRKVLFLLLYGGGLRVSEACRMEWRALQERQVRVLGKGQKERLIPLPEQTVKELKVLKALSDSKQYVFGSQALNPRVAYGWIRQQGREAGLLNDLYPHALRHSYATHLLAGGANLRILQKLLGHESLRATEKYTHLGIDQLARTLEKTHPLGQKKAR